MDTIGPINYGPSDFLSATNAAWNIHQIDKQTKKQQ